MRVARFFQEGELEFDFTRAVNCRKFDHENHGLSHCMKAVDFVVEEKDRLLFIEVKDLEATKVPEENRTNFIEELKRSSSALIRKCRDSFLYEYGFQRTNKPVFYIVLLEWAHFDVGFITTQQDELRRLLPVEGPPNHPWTQRFVQDCFYMNLSTWNHRFPHFPARRI